MSEPKTIDNILLEDAILGGNRAEIVYRLLSTQIDETNKKLLAEYILNLRIKKPTQLRPQRTVEKGTPKAETMAERKAIVKRFLELKASGLNYEKACQLIASDGYELFGERKWCSSKKVEAIITDSKKRQIEYVEAREMTPDEFARFNWGDESD